MKQTKQIITGLIAIGTLCLTSWPAIAEEHHEHEGAREHHEVARHEAVREHHEFAVRDFHRFNRDERKLWRGGRWNNTCYLGRCGWWWFAGGMWYFYEHRVGPYPVIVSEITYLEPIEVAPVVVAPQAPVVVAPPAPVVVAPQTQAPPQPPAQTWYYCESSKTYYPYVQNCPEGWKSVPAQPPQGAPR